MVTFFAPKDRVKMVGLQDLDVRCIGTQAVFGDDELKVRVVLTQRGNKPFGGMAFAIIFARAVLLHDTNVYAKATGRLRWLLGFVALRELLDLRSHRLCA